MLCTCKPSPHPKKVIIIIKIMKINKPIKKPFYCRIVTVYCTLIFELLENFIYLVKFSWSCIDRIFYLDRVYTTNEPAHATLVKCCFQGGKKTNMKLPP